MKRFAASLLVFLALPAAPASGALDLQGVDDFDRPTYLTAPPGDETRLFVTERAGEIRVVVDGVKRPDPFLDISSRVTTQSEGGLLSMAFARDYEQSGKFYVYYVDTNHDIRVDQFKASSGNEARETSRQQIIRIPSPPDTHKGGQVQMTPDGYLLLATGDGGTFLSPSKKAQDKRSLLGKLIRIKPAPQRPSSRPQYFPHPDNPHVGPGETGDPAIMASGLRNPYRFSLDRDQPKRIAIGDVGHSRTEEVNAGSLATLSGANFGWPCFEGNHRLLDCEVNDHRKPTLTYGHGSGNCSITGGYVNRAPGLPRQGHYFFGDYCSGDIWTAKLGRRGRDGTPLNVPSLVSFGEDARGRLYTVSLDGQVSRIVRG